DRRRAALLYRDAHAVRCSSTRRPVEALDTHHDAIAFLTLLANLDKTGERHARDGILQDRMRNAHGLQRGNCKPRSHRSKSERERKAKKAPAGQTCGSDARDSQHGSRPPGRFAVSGEVANDANPKCDREPGHQAAGRYLGRCPLGNQPAQPPDQIGDAIRQEQACGPAGKVRCPGLGANALLAATGIRSGHAPGASLTQPVTTWPPQTHLQVVATAFASLWFPPWPRYRAGRWGG